MTWHSKPCTRQTHFKAYFRLSTIEMIFLILCHDSTAFPSIFITIFFVCVDPTTFHWKSVCLRTSSIFENLSFGLVLPFSYVLPSLLDWNVKKRCLTNDALFEIWTNLINVVYSVFFFRVYIITKTAYFIWTRNVISLLFNVILFWIANDDEDDSVYDKIMSHHLRAFVNFFYFFCTLANQFIAKLLKFASHKTHNLFFFSVSECEQ